MAPTLSTPDASDPELVHGSLITLRRKCGKAACWCADSEQDRHESPALSFSVDGRTRMLTLHADEVDIVAAAVGRYRAARAELEEAAAGYDQVRAWLEERRRGDTDR